MLGEGIKITRELHLKHMEMFTSEQSRAKRVARVKRQTRLLALLNKVRARQPIRYLLDIFSLPLIGLVLQRMPFYDTVTIGDKLGYVVVFLAMFDL